MNFNSEAPEEKVLSIAVQIGWEHEVVEDEKGRRIEFHVDGAGNRVPRSYTIPVSLTAAQLFERGKAVSAETLQAVATGDIEALMTVLDALIGDDIVGRIGSDETVPVSDFVEFMSWILGQYNLADIFGGPGN
jgi:hypothetical protein